MVYLLNYIVGNTSPSIQNIEDTTFLVILNNILSYYES
jgi:hypothetical protein